MNVVYLISGIILSILLQVRCDEDTVSTSIGSQRNKTSNFFQHLGEQLTNLEQGPIHVRAKRSVDNDQCHSLQTKSLPSARHYIQSAWNQSINAFLSLTNSLSHLKQCASWNIFVTIPCGLKAAVELTGIYKTYSGEIFGFLKDVKSASVNTTVDFYHCAKVLLNHRS